MQPDDVSKESTIGIFVEIIVALQWDGTNTQAAC